MSNLDQDPFAWLIELFKYEYCAECGGDWRDHDPVAVMGCWFARCKHPIPEDLDDEAYAAVEKAREVRRDMGLPITKTDFGQADHNSPYVETIPWCENCKEHGRDTPADYFMPGSSYAGQKEVVWRPLCRVCAEGWYGGGDWNGPAYALVRV